jgi:hypothetical protein
MYVCMHVCMFPTFVQFGFVGFFSFSVMDTPYFLILLVFIASKSNGPARFDWHGLEHVWVY